MDGVELYKLRQSLLWKSLKPYSSVINGTNESDDFKPVPDRGFTHVAIHLNIVHIAVGSAVLRQCRPKAKNSVRRKTSRVPSKPCKRRCAQPPPKFGKRFQLLKRKISKRRMWTTWLKLSSKYAGRHLKLESRSQKRLRNFGSGPRFHSIGFSFPFCNKALHR
jgi:hypothetical protein